MFKLVVLLTLLALCCALDETHVTETEEDINITVLDLSNQDITFLNGYNFSKYRLLEQIDLSNNNIGHIREDTFIKNTNLKKLNLAGNKNLILPQYSTLLISSVKELNLSNCHIKDLPSNIFDGLIDLKIVDLSRNPLGKNAIQISTLLALMSPEKLILPNVDENLIRNICKEFDILLDIKTDSIRCADVRSGKWAYTAKNNNEEEEGDYGLNKENNKRQADNVTTIKPDNISVSTVHNIEILPEIIPQTSDTTTESQLEDVTLTTNIPKISEATDVPTTVETDTPKELPDTIDGDNTHLTSNASAEFETTINDHSTSTTANSTFIVSTTDSPVNTEISHKTTETIVETKKIYTTISILDITPSTQLSETKTATNASIDIHHMQRNLPLPTENNQKEVHAEVKAQATEDQVKTAVPESSSTGTTILIILVVAVVVAGLAAFGYKFYKSRQYQAASSVEPVERELQEIKVERNMNGPAMSPEIIEEEPLMDNERGDGATEIKEFDDVHLAQNGHGSTSRGGGYVPVTTTTFKGVNNENK